MRQIQATVAILASTSVLCAQRPWQQITTPSINEAAANFKTPPHEYGAIQPFTSWNGPDAQDRMARIVQDLDRLKAAGMFIVNVSPGRGEPKYLSPEHMAQMKFIVAEAAKRGMKIWIQDESDYPSGFAGGKISQEYPQLTMQGLDADIRINVMPGQTLTMPTPPDTLAAFAVFAQTGAVEKVPVDSGGIHWRAPAPPPGAGGYPKPWELVLVRHIFRSSPTRSFNREDGTRAKDSQYSLIDYLNPDATRALLKITHDTYFEVVGDQFGKTVLGFFGDEPDYTCFMPWTPTLLTQFRQKKGYDLLPYLPLFFEPKMTDEAWRVKADYYDVWSSIFGETFFGAQSDWAAKHNVEYLVHLNHEETGSRLELPEDLTRNEGDFFRDMRHVEVPGIDNLTQLIPSLVHGPDGKWNINNNFPKLASSAAHLFGRPKVWTEEGGGTGIDGKYQLDYQFVRGVNAMQIRVPAPVTPQASMLAWYTNRGGYLMAVGRPAAQVALYHPVNSLWMGDEEADRSATKLGWQLLEHQVDWDYFDEQSLSSVASIANGGFQNLSGQTYRALVIPATTVITRTALDRLREFTRAGGKAIFVGKTPRLVVDRTFLDAKDAPDLGFATLIEGSGDITPRVLAALPKPDVTLDAAFPRLTYTHRAWRDADMYFFFNESDKEEARIATLAGRGAAQVWDLTTGEIHPLSGAAAQGGYARIPLVFEPYEAKVIVVGPVPSISREAEPPITSSSTVLDLGGDWTIDLNGKQLSTPLKPWSELGGAPGFAGPAVYRKQFTAPAGQTGKRLFLELGDVREYARIRVNGKDLEPRAWQPYRWDLAGAMKPGVNDVEVEIRGTAGGGGRGRGGTPPVSGLLGPVRIVAR